MTKEEYLALIQPAMDLVMRKQADYQNAVPLAAYFPFQDKSYVQMLHTKTQRLVSLVSRGGEPNFESVGETVLDLINYAVFYLAYLNGEVRDGL